MIIPIISEPFHSKVTKHWKNCKTSLSVSIQTKRLQRKRNGKKQAVGTNKLNMKERSASYTEIKSEDRLFGDNDVLSAY